jgi:CHASE2 domain-containing sensor protein
VRQPGCEAVTKGDRIAMQLFDPSAMPTLRSAPQRLTYESVLAGDAETLQVLTNKIVLVGTQFANTDVLSLGAGGDRWGVELFAQQIDALSREVAIQPLGPVAQLALMIALGLTGAFVAFHLRKWQAIRRNAVLLVIAILFAVFVVIWYRSEQQLIGLHYGVGALILGAWIVGILNRRKTT